jgi:hypothetical protein
MNIRELSAGRELDALVAEKVMGCKVRIGFPIYENGVGMKLKGSNPYCECENKAHWTESRGESDLFSDIPNYSTDIAAAWAVLKKISTMRLDPEYHPDSKIMPKNKYCRPGLLNPMIQLTFYEHDDDYRITIGRCKGVGCDDDIRVGVIGGDFYTSMPLLICRTALLLVEKQP